MSSTETSRRKVCCGRGRSRASSGSRFVGLPCRGRVIESDYPAFEPSPVGRFRLEGTTVLTLQLVPEFGHVHVFVQAHQGSIPLSVSTPLKPKKLSSWALEPESDLGRQAPQEKHGGYLLTIKDSSRLGDQSKDPKPPNGLPCRRQTHRRRPRTPQEAAHLGKMAFADAVLGCCPPIVVG
jgi:hypothetical protein